MSTSIYDDIVTLGTASSRLSVFVNSIDIEIMVRFSGILVFFQVLLSPRDPRIGLR